MKDNEKQILRVYRQMIGDEINRPEFRREKKAFIDEHFRSNPVFFWRPAVLVPLAVGCVIFAVWSLFRVQPVEVMPVPETLRSESMRSAEQVTESVLSKQPKVMGPEIVPVVVKRLESQAGPTMIYQKTENGVPVVIVWVFAGK